MTDRYLDLIRVHWETIARAYAAFADNHPVILLHLNDAKVYAYPYAAFKATLSPRSQKSLEREYRLALKNNDVVVFVRDDENRQLISTSLPAAPMLASHGEDPDRGRGRRTGKGTGERGLRVRPPGSRRPPAHTPEAKDTPS